MRFQTPLVPARLIRRYKRFLADAILEADGREITAHCPNPGAMLGLNVPGSRIWLEPNDDPKKKLKYGWRISELEGGHLAGIDTGIPNKVVREALEKRQVPELSGYSTVSPEVKYGTNSRVDFHLSGEGPEVFVEVKNVHLRREGSWAEFPDCVTARGTKHLQELVEVVAKGHRAVMFYLVQRTDCDHMRLAGDLDPEYAKAFDLARAAGVEMLAYSTKISTRGVRLGDPILVDPSQQSVS